MKILFITMAESVHSMRWITSIADQNWELFLFPTKDTGMIHLGFENITLFSSFYNKQNEIKKTVRIKGINVLNDKVAAALRMAVREIFPRHHVKKLVKIIYNIKPDIIHSLELQGSGYLTMEVKKMIPKNFPKWIVTNWGSDIYLFGQLPTHKGKIQEVLNNCDYYSCECQRDVTLGKQFGFNGTVLPVLPNSGGFDLEEIQKLKAETPLTSERKCIMLKGYQHWAGRALVGLRALTRCSDILKGYTVKIYSILSHPYHKESDVQIAAELFTHKTGIPVEIIPNQTSQLEILKHHATARISIGLSISDAISTSLLEAIILGSFPIQSDTSCANEWIVHGQTGFIVPPEDPEIIEKYIRRALSDDKLVDDSAKKNWETAKQRLDKKVIKKQILTYYKAVSD